MKQDFWLSGSPLGALSVLGEKDKDFNDLLKAISVS